MALDTSTRPAGERPVHLDLAPGARLVSPLDERVRPTLSLAPRPAGLAGARVVLLDIGKRRGAELLDRLEERFAARGADVSRLAKEIFSRPASAEVIEEAARRGELLVEALAD